MSVASLALKNPDIAAGAAESGSIVWTVPATWHHFTATEITQIINGALGALASGGLVIVDDDTFSLVVPDGTGLYTVAPAQNLLLLFSFFNVTADDVAANAYQALVTLTKV